MKLVNKTPKDTKTNLQTGHGISGGAEVIIEKSRIRSQLKSIEIFGSRKQIKTAYSKMQIRSDIG